MLASRVDDLARELLPAAKQCGSYYTIGNVAGDPGKSLVIHRAGPKTGRWRDYATDDHGDMLDLIAASLGLDTHGAMEWALDYLGQSDRPAPTARRGRAPRSATTPPAQDRRERGNRLAALELWARARPIAGTLGETYLRARGITIDLPASLRFVASCKHTQIGLLLPALIGAITGRDRKITAITRIYLRSDGTRKAEVPTPKMTLGPMGDGAVRLGPAGDILGLAEGCETALSAMQLYGVPVCARRHSEIHRGRPEVEARPGKGAVICRNGTPGRSLRIRRTKPKTGRYIRLENKPVSGAVSVPPVVQA